MLTKGISAGVDITTLKSVRAYFAKVEASDRPTLGTAVKISMLDVTERGCYGTWSFGFQTSAGRSAPWNNCIIGDSCFWWEGCCVIW